MRTTDSQSNCTNIWHPISGLVVVVGGLPCAHVSVRIEGPRAFFFPPSQVHLEPLSSSGLIVNDRMITGDPRVGEILWKNRIFLFRLLLCSSPCRWRHHLIRFSFFMVSACYRHRPGFSDLKKWIKGYFLMIFCRKYEISMFRYFVEGATLNDEEEVLLPRLSCLAPKKEETWW